MTDLVVQLRARVAELRIRAEFRDRYRYDQFCAELAVYDRSLADLIDGMLKRHEPTGGRPNQCDSDGYLFPCPDLRDLAAHVCSVIGEVTA